MQDLCFSLVPTAKAGRKQGVLVLAQYNVQVILLTLTRLLWRRIKTHQEQQRFHNVTHYMGSLANLRKQSWRQK